MRTVKVYTKEDCKFSAALLNLLKAREIPYEEILLTPDSDEHKALGERTGSMQLPQAFIGVTPLGSNQQIIAADQSGMLAELVQD